MVNIRVYVAYILKLDPSKMGWSEMEFVLSNSVPLNETSPLMHRKCAYAVTTRTIFLKLLISLLPFLGFPVHYSLWLVDLTSHSWPNAFLESKD